jgi:hypothetical protein
MRKRSFNLKNQVLPWLVWGVMAAAPALGVEYTASGTVTNLRSHDAALASLDWFALSNVSSLGTCGVYNGAVIFRINDDDRGWRQFALVLAARSKGTTVSVQIDDAIKDQYGYCILRFIDY